MQNGVNSRHVIINKDTKWQRYMFECEFLTVVMVNNAENCARRALCKI